MNPQAGQSNTNNDPENPNEVDLPVSVNPSTNIVAPEETMNVLPLFPLTSQNPSEANLSLSMNSATNVAAPEYAVNIVQLPFKRSSSDNNTSGEYVTGGTSNSAEQPAQAKRRETESRVSVLNSTNNTNLSSSSPLLAPLPPSHVVRLEHNFFTETTPTESRVSVLNSNNNTNSLLLLSSLLPPPPHVVRQEHNFFNEITATESLVSVLYATNNRNSSSLSSSLAPPPPRVRQEHNFSQTIPTRSRVSVLNANNNTSSSSSLSSLLSPPTRAVREEHNFFNETRPIGSRVSVLNANNNTNTSWPLSSLLSSAPRVVREENNFFNETRPIGSRVSVLNANNNTNSLWPLSSLLSSPPHVREEHNFFSETRPIESPVSELNANNNTNSSWPLSLLLSSPPRVVREENNFFNETRPIGSRVSVLNANDNTNSLLSLPSLLSSPPHVVREEHNFFSETRPIGSRVSELNANNTNSSLLSLLLSPQSRIVQEENNFFHQTTPTEASQGGSHIRQHNAGPILPRASRSVNMIRASSYSTRPSLHQSQAPQHNLQPLDVRNRTSFTIGSPNISRRNMLPYSNSNAGANAIMAPLQGQGSTIISQTSSDLHQRLFNDPAGPSTNAQPRRTTANEVQFLQGLRRPSGPYTQMLEIDNVEERDTSQWLEWFAREHILEAEPNPQEQNVDEVPPGLSEETIMQHLESVTFVSIDDGTPENEKEKCPICLEEFENGNQVGKLHSCKHMYHVDCLKNWLLERNFCPVCKRVALETNNNENENGNANA